MTVEPDTGCWRWTGAAQPNGYGRVKIGGRNGRALLAHRAVYAAVRGPIPDGHDLDHLCRNRACVNPMHLEPVSHRENALRGASPNAVAWRTNTCKRGHDLAGAYIYKGGRRCRACRRERKKAGGLL